MPHPVLIIRESIPPLLGEAQPRDWFLVHKLLLYIDEPGNLKLAHMTAQVPERQPRLVH